MRIPKIVHQLWKSEEIPDRWKGAVDSVKRYHKGWEYRLWTDERMDAHVKAAHPELYPIYAGFDRVIMRADIFRCLLMHDFGGLYCDLDYEFVRPYDYGDAEVVLSLEYDLVYGDPCDQIANYVMASVPGHALWQDLLADVQSSPPFAATASDICIVTGPMFLTRIFLPNRDRYSGARLTPKPVLSPRRVHGPHEKKFYVNSGITCGFHHGWGSWRERWTGAYLGRKIGRLFGISSR